MSERSVVGVIGATSLVGRCVMPLLVKDGHQVVAFSRQVCAEPPANQVSWRQLSVSVDKNGSLPPITDWLCLAPVWVLPHYFALLQAHGARRIVALSSTSRFTKVRSTELADAAVAAQLASGEVQLQSWAEQHGIEWVILRPTMIYGLGQDKNLSEIARFVRRFFFFPLVAQASGLRQPIHVRDVASACAAGLRSPAAANHAYNIAGQEALPYREMVRRIFVASRQRPRLVTIPLFAFRLALACFRVLPKYRNWSVAMAERMNRDMVFDCSDAVRDLGFAPRAFAFGPEDLPR